MPSVPRDLKRALRAGVLLGDGGMGSSLLELELDPERDFAGHAGCCELLNVRCPDQVRAVHASFLDVGCDAITTNSFCADAPTLARRGLGGRSREFGLSAARLARAAADAASGDGRARFVLGSMGPGFARPTATGAPLEPLEHGYRELAEALLEGGVDGLLVETVRDAAQARAALSAARAALELAGSSAALILSFTPFENGTLAGGITLKTGLEELARFEPVLVAVNCLPGAAACAGPLASLAEVWNGPLGAWPNAGEPLSVAGQSGWPIRAQAFASELVDLARRFDLRLLAGCCGTTPAHIGELVDRLRC